MEKKFGFIQLDPSLIEWLLQKLDHTPMILKTEELKSTLEDLLEKKISFLALSIDHSEQSAPEAGMIRAGDLTIMKQSRKVLRDGKEISLTRKEFDILYFLASNRGKVFSKEQIYETVWQSSYALGASNIMAFIRKLRQKIETDPENPRYIQTVWGIGYRFNDQMGQSS